MDFGNCVIEWESLEIGLEGENPVVTLADVFEDT